MYNESASMLFCNRWTPLFLFGRIESKLREISTRPVYYCINRERSNPNARAWKNNKRGMNIVMVRRINYKLF